MPWSARAKISQVIDFAAPQSAEPTCEKPLEMNAD
jgi:hypothetical protein